ncbi:MAG: hypothetical protein U9Q74_02930, partial [Gemmatimonadota bacterium]|nr:hypothetical protein [Gemmatimonadota bacterium]
MNDEAGCCAALRRILGREAAVEPLLDQLEVRDAKLGRRIAAEFANVFAECRRGLADDDDSRGSSGPGDPAVIDPIDVQ